jgi:hypothetical protein
MKAVSQTVITADRYYTIASNSGSVIEATAAGADGADLRLGEYSHQPTQEWSFVRAGDGVYRIKNRATGKVIDLMMSGTVNGTWLHQWEDNNASTQLWIVAPTSEGTVKLQSQWANGKCLDTVGMGTEVGAVLQIWQEVDGGDQLWTIQEVKEHAKRATAAKKAAAAPKAPKAPKAEAAAAPVAVEAPVEPAAKPAKKAAKTAAPKKSAAAKKPTARKTATKSAK